MAGAGLIFLHNDAPTLAHGLAHRGLPLVVISALAGITSLALLYLQHSLTARFTAATAVTAVLWAWALAHYPTSSTPP